ncbi:MAG: diacylglycerol/lipid kinase family protein, partial [Flavobacteriales bacterium]
MKSRIRFIINPRSGVGTKQELPSLIRQTIDSKRFETEIRYTEYPRHAAELSAEAEKSGTEIIAVAGGDGTVNEAAGALLHSASSLAVIPLGSGNGLARHLSIPIAMSDALENINSGKRKVIDSFKA